MNKPSEVFKNIRFAKLDPHHDKGHKGGSTDDEEHGAVSEIEWAQQLAHQKKRAMQEEKKDKYDEGEYDREGDMAKSDLRSIIANAKRVHDMLEDSSNLPEWVQSKITLAEDYISTVANYMASEMSEEVVVEEDIKSARIIKSLYKKKGVTEEVWHKTGKEAVHRETGKKTYEYKKYDNDGKETGDREYRDEKGKSMGESVEIQEGKMKDIATNKAEDERLVPFDKPYKTVKNVIKDKSGAKHTPMSRARDLARKGSRAASIVREAAENAKKKKKEKEEESDKFQKDPELSTQIMK